METGIGNILRHDYDRVAPDVLWRLWLDDLPALVALCQHELAEAEAAGTLD